MDVSSPLSCGELSVSSFGGLSTKRIHTAGAGGVTRIGISRYLTSYYQVQGME